MIDNLVKLVLDKGGSVSHLKIPSTDSGGTGLCNPSIFVDKDGTILLNLRNVGYALYHCENEQKFQGRWGPLAYLHPEDDCYLRTTNFLCILDPKTLEISSYKQVDTSQLDIQPVWDFIGLEDARVVRWDDKMYLTGVRRDTKPNGEGRMELSQVVTVDSKVREVKRSRIEPPNDPNSYCEKNWMPIEGAPPGLEGGRVYSLDPFTIIVNSQNSGQIDFLWKGSSYPMLSGWRGGTPVKRLGNAYYAVIHKTIFSPVRNYVHRVLKMSVNEGTLNPVSVSREFVFRRRFDVEFCSGLEFVESQTFVSFGYQDKEAWLTILKTPDFTRLAEDYDVVAFKS